VKRARIVVALSLLAIATFAGATQSPNTAKGFNANGVYQMNGIDNIATFNGNLTLTIPIGQAYPIGGGLSYQLRLYGNGNLWESEDRYDLDDETSADCKKPGELNPVPCIQAYPDRRANAGIGFTLSLGRLFPPDEQTNEQGQWIYEGPDGSEHKFFDNLSGQNDGNANYLYTLDGTYLRMVVVNSTTRRVEFPSGEVHTFSPGSTIDPDLVPWRITAIGNKYKTSALTVAYNDIDSDTKTMVISDGFRSHTITFDERSFESGILDMYSDPDPPQVDTRFLVSSVQLATFGGTTGTYNFTYTQGDIRRPDWHNIPTAYESNYARTQMLTGLQMPDGTSFSWSYITTDFTGKSGLPYEMVLPTGGKIQWAWGYYQFPQWTGDFPNTQTPVGVTSRKLYDRGNILIGEWTYANQLDGAWNYPNLPAPRELKVTITDPLGNKTENFFDVSDWDSASSGYGLPYTVKVTDGTGTRFMSQKYIPSGSSTPVRTTYVKYENDGGLANRGYNPRRISSRTVYNDDGNAILDEDLSDYDGLGHYRTTTTSGTGVPKRVATTNYNAANGTYPGTFVAPSVSSPWLLETFSTKTLTEGDKVLKSEAWFDATTGFLRRTRAIKDTTSGTRGPTDVITVLTPDDVVFSTEIIGNVIQEEVYGGDGANLSTGALNTLTLSTADRVSRLDYEYQYGAMRRSRFYGPSGSLSFYNVDNDNDTNTGVPSTARDSAGVTTDYLYDSMGRVTAVRPKARAWMGYTYPNFTSSYEIVANQYQPPPSGTTPGTRIGRSRYVIDGIGRVNVEYVEMPGNIESRRETTLNALGWQMDVSELGTGITLPKTTFTYDMFGRVVTSTAPDNSLITFVYTGVRTKTRTSKISTVSPSSADTSVATTEESDLYGRLVRVTEKSGPTTSVSPIGANVVTEYGYDPADHLVSVTMNKGGTTVQQRFFDFDGRGLLRWEAHPESGVVSYTYDGRGVVLTKTQASANSIFDLKYSYDAAGRLLEVDGRNPFYGNPGEPAFRPMKTFTYATSNSGTDLRNGKMVTATRYNYPENYGDPVWKIEDTYQYKDTAGRRTDRSTAISRIDNGYEDVLKTVTMSQAYNELDLPTTVTYPMCTDCGAPPVDPSKSGITRTYDHGRLITMGRSGSQAYVQNATYWPNGMRNLLPHGNGVTDTQVVGSMPRPSQIAFGTYDRCVQPTITTQPANVTGGSTVTLSVTAAGTGPLEYEWYDITGNAVVGTTSSINVNPSVTSEYYVTVTGACGFVESDIAKVSIGSCSLPTTGMITPSRQPDGSWILRPDPSARSGATYSWRIQPANTVVGTSRELAVTISQTTTYTLTITDSCGSSSATSVTVTLPLPITKTGLAATMSSSSLINITWPAVSGITEYILERRSGAGWVEIARPTTNSYADNTVTANKTYAYRVTARASNSASTSDYSNSDVATTRTFTAAASGNTITATPTNDMLAAVNSVRAAAGWAPLTWANILSPTDPIPNPGNFILARHVLSCRARMNEALQALGVPVQSYVAPELIGITVTAANINEVQQRAQ